jgi:hypothetical protein
VSVPQRLDVDTVVRRAAVVLAGVAFAGSWLHVVEFAAAKGQPWVLAAVIATMPEVSVAVCILVLRSGPALARKLWAALVLVTSAGFTVRANLGVVVPSDWTAVMVAVWPAWAAIGAAGLVEGPRHRPTAKPAARTATEPATPPATPTARPAKPAATRPATEPATTGPVAAVEDVRALPVAEQVAWFRRELPAHGARTAAQWAAITGLPQRTVERRLAAAREPVEQGPVGVANAPLAAGGAL